MAEIGNEELGIPEERKHPFKVTPLNEFLKKKLPPLQKLVGDFIYSEELTLFYGLSGLGKSMFAVQMGLAISEGQDLDLGNGIVLENQCEPMKVLYIDLELSERQFFARVKGLDGYSNFFYCNIESGQSLDAKTAQKVFEQIKACAKDWGAKCIIIDNITRVSGDIEKTEPAKEFMDACWNLVRDEKYNIIIVAHIKKKDSFLPITKNDLRGSGVLYDLADSSLSIGKAKRPKIDKKMEVYLLQMKTRSDKYYYDEESVIHCVQNKENDFLKLDAIGTCYEIELLSENIPINEKAPNRKFYTIACLYYGSSRKAQGKLAEAGIKAPWQTINDNRNAYAEAHKDDYELWESWDRDRQKSYLESQSPDSNNCLPYAEGHVPKSNDDDLIPF